jgi:hypothetical protein
MNRRLAILSVGLLAVALTAVPAPAQGGQQKLIAYFNALPSQTLDAAEIAGLRQMLQDEKLARDVYLAMGYFWNLPIFANIAASEQEHMKFVRLLYTRYNLADPIPSDQIGVFADPFYSYLFNILVVVGSQSLQNALWVGTAIEDLDIDDLLVLAGQTDNKDIRMIYYNLCKGSRNHLRAYYPNLVKWGGSYQALFIDQKTFDQIMNSKPEGGVVYDENNQPLP